MEHAEDIMDKVGEQYKWSEDDKLEAALEYINNQGDNSAFQDFLERWGDEG